jgi:hypothetical protein
VARAIAAGFEESRLKAQRFPTSGTVMVSAADEGMMNDE